MPVRSRIQLSDVSSRASRSAFERTPLGSAPPIPATRNPVIVSSTRRCPADGGSERSAGTGPCSGRTPPRGSQRWRSASSARAPVDHVGDVRAGPTSSRSRYALGRARVAEWQTQRTQNPPSERACGFESHPGHRVIVLVDQLPQLIRGRSAARRPVMRSATGCSSSSSMATGSAIRQFG